MKEDTQRQTDSLSETARALVAKGKGVLAADESTGTIEKRFHSIQVPSTEETRRRYRELLFTTPGLDDTISGIILYDETIRQKSQDGVRFVEVLEKQGILPGIKVDKGAKALAHFPEEKVTEGLDGLRGRLQEYRQIGARFTKWRAVIQIGPGCPTRTCLRANAQALARFAALSQEQGLVPIVEPEVLMDGNHTIERHFEATAAAQEAVFSALREHRVGLHQMLLKPNMVLSGTECPQQASMEEVVRFTLQCLRDQVPASVPGIVFLSGGQSDVMATRHLNALNAQGRAPWELSFSFGRALQAPALKAWGGREENFARAQRALLHRARCNGAARLGNYDQALEDSAPPD
jgi:fructose-bisphosphate aldolase, class I